MKKIPIKIIISIVLTGLIAIAGEIILSYDMERMSKLYYEIAGEYQAKCEDMSTIQELIYEHQAIVAIHISSTDADQMAEYENRGKKLSDELSARINGFEDRLKTEKEHQLYHKVYSDYYSYLSNADIALKMSREGNDATARYYATGSMSDFVDRVNDNIDELTQISDNQLSGANLKMDRYIYMSRIIRALCIILILTSLCACIIYTYKLSHNLDEYKEELEKEVEKKAATIQQNNEHMIQYQTQTIIGMANLIEGRDGNTGEHVKRTSRYVGMIAKQAKLMGYYEEQLTDEYIELLVKAAPLHDVGKIVVSDTILLKPGKLTAEEFEEIKRHTIEGGKIVREVIGGIGESKYIDIAEKVALYHHEKWDGSGYSAGLKGNEIPLCARIMAIADVFDALVSKRCYKSAMSVPEAFEIIENSSGTHFDPLLVKAFLRLKKEIILEIEKEL